MGFMSHNGNNNVIIILDNFVVGNPSSETSCGLLFTEGNNANNNNNEMGMKKGPWTAAEDRILIDYVSKHGEGNWNVVQRNSGLKRCGKSCRLRWANHLRPNLKKGQFAPEEEHLILELHAKYGNKWARMASQLPGRTDNEIKNYWNTRVKKRLRKGLPLYPQDINSSSKRVPRHSYSHSYDENTMTQQLKHLVTTSSTMPHIDTNDFTFQSQPSSSSQNLYQYSTLNNNNNNNNNYNNHSLITPLYDHHDLTSSMTPLFNFPNPSPISPNRQRKSSNILRAISSMPDIVGSYQHFSTNSMYDISSFECQSHTQTLPLPSSQVIPHHGLSSSDITNFDVNVTHCSSDGFLESLLQESERFGFGNSHQGGQLDSSDHEKSHPFDGYDHSLASKAMHSSLLEMQPTDDDHEQMNSNNLIPKYLDNLPNSNDESIELTNSSLSDNYAEMKLSKDLFHEHTNSLYSQILGEVIQFQPSYGMVMPNNGESARVSNNTLPSAAIEDSSLEFDMQHHINSLFPAGNSWPAMADQGTNTYLG